MKNISEFLVEEAQSITEDFAKEIAEETMTVKGFNIYFVNFGGYLGYSYLVFKNNYHIYNLNMYERYLWWLAEEKEEDTLKVLKEYYLKKINNTFYAEEEIAEPLKSRDEYESKRLFLHSCHGKQGEDFIKRRTELLELLDKRKDEAADSFEYQKNVFLKEMHYHANAFSWNASVLGLDVDYDMLSAFGNITRKNGGTLAEYFDELNFSETQRKAYKAARNEYW